MTRVSWWGLMAMAVGGLSLAGCGSQADEDSVAAVASEGVEPADAGASLPGAALGTIGPSSVMLYGGTTGNTWSRSATIYDGELRVVYQGDNDATPPLGSPAILGSGEVAVVVGTACEQFIADEGCRPGSYASAVFDAREGAWKSATIPAALSAGSSNAVGVGLATSDGAEYAVFNLREALDDYWAFRFSDSTWIDIQEGDTAATSTCFAGDILIAITQPSPDVMTTVVPTVNDGSSSYTTRLAEPVTDDVTGIVMRELLVTGGPGRLTATCGADSVLVAGPDGISAAVIVSTVDGTASPVAGPSVDTYSGARVWAADAFVLVGLTQRDPSLRLDPTTTRWSELGGSDWFAVESAVWNGERVVAYSPSDREDGLGGGLFLV